MEKNVNQILVLGMHRSGTSCLSGILRGAGVYFGDVSLRNEFNKKGNHESIKVNQINNIILRKSGGEWFDPKTVNSISLVDRTRIFLHNREMRLKTKSFNRIIYGIKDPRLVFTHRYWKVKSSVTIGTFRHPEKVGNSLYARAQKMTGKTKKYTNKDWLDVWYRYNLEFLKSYNENNFFFVNFDWEADKYFNSIDQFVSEITDGKLKVERSFFDESLINENTSKNKIADKYQELYDELNNIALNMSSKYV